MFSIDKELNWRPSLIAIDIIMQWIICYSSSPLSTNLNSIRSIDHSFSLRDLLKGVNEPEIVPACCL